MTAPERRHDIDALRVIAIGLLLIYHIAISFQSWGIMIGFITTDKPWESLWIPMSVLNVWRIPFLFFVSGMGVYFAMRRRNWKELLRERTTRILIPFLIGIFCIVPLSTLLWQHYNGFALSYVPNPGHLWFLGNIFVYVIVLSPLFYHLKNHEDGRVVAFLRKLFATPVGLIPVVLIFLVEVIVINPMPFELYAMTWHGFVLGFIAFFFGFCFVLSGDTFWHMVSQWRWLFLAIAACLYIIRYTVYDLRAPGYLVVPESNCWIFMVFGFGYKYLNVSSNAWTYLSRAAYPVYISHMIMLSLSSMLIFPIRLDPALAFLLVIILTFAGCMLFYELIVRRIKAVRLIFGG